MEAHTTIDVSCIIINYNTSQFTYKAVKSILETHSNSELTFKIIVVDNNSKVEDYIRLKTRLDALKNTRIKLFRSKINTGFGSGNMLGVQLASKSKYYAFVNNDTLQITKNCFNKLKVFMESNHDVAVCSPQMLDENKKFRVTIDHFSSLQREILKRYLLEFLFPKKYLNRKIRYAKPTKVDYVQGAFMFVDAMQFNSIGGFDTNLFLYYEESDVCRRLLKQKQKFTYLVPSVEYIHYKGASTERNILIKIEQKLSLLYYIEKHYGWFAKNSLSFYFIIKYFFTSIIKPKYWRLWLILLKGSPISMSLKQSQIINEMNL